MNEAIDNINFAIGYLQGVEFIHPELPIKDVIVKLKKTLEIIENQ